MSQLVFARAAASDGRWIIGGVDEIAGVDVGMREQPANDVGVIAAVVGHLGDGAFADVVIAREACVSGAMDGGSPQIVVALCVARRLLASQALERGLSWRGARIPRGSWKIRNGGCERVK